MPLHASDGSSKTKKASSGGFLLHIREADCLCFEHVVEVQLTLSANPSQALGHHKSHLAAIEDMAASVGKGTAARQNQAKMLEATRTTLLRDVRHAQRTIKQRKALEHDR